jgi:hypothetical protein
MAQSIFTMTSFWYTAGGNAGQPDLKDFSGKTFTDEDVKKFENLDLQWLNHSRHGALAITPGM